MTQGQARQLRKLLEDSTERMTDEKIAGFPDFVEKWRPGVHYLMGKRLAWGGIVYKVLQDHDSQDGWEPDKAVSLYARVLIPDPDVIPEWEQPDSTNPYMKGDRVTHGGKTWESDVDYNVWEPGIFGWHEIDE